MSRNIRIQGKTTVAGSVCVPGDKSISHRVAMLAAVASGISTVRGFASSADCWATIDCLRRLGVRVEGDGEQLLIHGVGIRGWQPATDTAQLYVGNSGSTIRMLAGLLAGQAFAAELDGDASIRRRPMRRVIEPLRLMGARIDGTDGNYAPLRIVGSRLRAIDYQSPVASAQVKSCVLFAGLLADGRTSVTEPAASRNHTELMLREFGAPIEYTPGGKRVEIEGGYELQPLAYTVPGDLSSAAFFVAAATVLAGSSLTISGVNLNESRTAFLDVLDELGASIKREHIRVEHGEPVGDLRIESRFLRGAAPVIRLAPARIPNLIDEIPILAIIGTQLDGRLEVRDAAELRHKESDRIKTVVAGLRAMGVDIEEFEDGFAVAGPQQLRAARIATAGDHRIAMAFSIAGLLADGMTEIVGADCAEVSFPEFYQLLAAVTATGAISDA